MPANNAYDLPDLDDILAAPSAPPHATEIMCIWRDDTDGSMIIQLGEHYHRTRGDIKAAGQERVFMTALRKLAKIAKETEHIVTPKAPEPSVATPAPVPAQTEPEPPEQPVATSAPISDQTEPEPPVAAPAPVSDQTEPEPPVAAPAPISDQTEPEPPITAREQLAEPIEPPLETPNEAAIIEQIVPPLVAQPAEEEIGTFFGNFKNAFRRKSKTEAEPPPPVKSFAEQIEEILQQRRQGGALPGRSVHIHEAVGGGIRIQVDENAYEAVGDIAEQEVREFMQETIRLWEKQQQG